MRRTHRIGKRVTEAVGGRAAAVAEASVASHDRNGTAKAPGRAYRVPRHRAAAGHHEPHAQRGRASLGIRRERRYP